MQNKLNDELRKADTSGTSWWAGGGFFCVCVCVCVYTIFFM